MLQLSFPRQAGKKGAYTGKEGVLRIGLFQHPAVLFYRLVIASGNRLP